MTLLFLVPVGRSAAGSQSVEEKTVLDHLRDYIQQALSGQWQYSCTENILRIENKHEVVLTKRSSGENARRWDLRKSTKKSATYEYRLRLKGRKITEKRLAPSADNELLYEAKDTGTIFPYQNQNIVANPMEYLSRLTRGGTEYQVKGREILDKVEAWAVRFSSKINVSGRESVLSGKLWVHPETGAVLRMSLEPGSWSFFELDNIPKEYAEIPSLGHPSLRRSLSWTADFEAGNGGIRYPSHIEIREEYLSPGGEQLEANSWTISYGQFQFVSGVSSRAADPLSPLLMKASAYCDRLKSIALQYICDEHIVRTTYLYDVKKYVKGQEFGATGLPQKRWVLKRKTTREILYDYQLLKKNEQLVEKRAALTVDGKKWSKSENPPNILPYQAQYIVYGPVGFLSAYWQTRFDYFEQDSENMNGRSAVVFISQPNSFREENSVYGKLWVEDKTGAVLRIDWDPESIDFFRSDETPAAFGGLDKQLIWSAYFEVEKNGIFFPSRQEIREEYVGPKGETVIADVWTITYENYKFFTVGTDVEIKK